MLFSINIPDKNQQKLQRKEKDSFLVISDMSKTSIITSKHSRGISPKFYEKRASQCASLRGSITIEAALAVPFFFFALVCVIYLLEIMAIQMSVWIGMEDVMGTVVCDLGTGQTFTTEELEGLIVASIGEEKLNNSIIVNGSGGLDCSATSISQEDGIVTLQVVYEVHLPIPDFGIGYLEIEERMIAKGWTGYEGSTTSYEDMIVYITDNQSVYHVDYSCTHLQLNISSENYGDLGSLRNAYEGSYSACSICVDGDAEWEETSRIFVAEYGDCYHTTLSCSGLIRTIYAVSLSEVIGKGACSRCGL